MEKVLLIGAGGFAKVIVDTIEAAGIYEIAGFVDNEGVEDEYRSYKVIGSDRDLDFLYSQGISNAVVAIGFLGGSDKRRNIFSRLKGIGFSMPPVIDRTAVIAGDVIIGEGTYIGKNAVVNSEAKIGKMCIINTSSVIEHECSVEDFSHVSVGAVACGQVKIGPDVFVGANAAIIQGVKVAGNCIIGAGAVVTGNITKEGTYVGVPARMVIGGENC